MSKGATMPKVNDDKAIQFSFPDSRVWAATIAALLIGFVFYYFYGGLVTFSLLASIVLVIFYYAQDILLFHPDLPANSRIYVAIPTTHNLPHETVNISSENVVLHAFWIKQPETEAKSVPTFVYFHGNAGNMGHRMQNVWGIYYNLHCNILMVEYRGYGLSTGVPTERGFAVDARIAVDYLYTRNDLDHSQIVIFGRSLGGAVAIDLVADLIYSQKVMCAIVENTFTSIPDMAVELIHPYIKFLPNIFYKNKFNSMHKISKCSVPFLFISGLADNLVPPRMMRALYTKCGSENKQILEFIGGSHNDTWIVDGYYEGIKAFLSQCQRIDPPPLQKSPEKSNMWHQIHEV